MQVEVGFGDLRTEAVGVFDLHLAPVPEAGMQFIGARVSVECGDEEALRMLLHHLATSAARYDRRRIGVGEKRADFPARLPAFLADRMRSQDAERVAVISANYRFDFFAGHENL